jgi:hypothetical protein
MSNIEEHVKQAHDTLEAARTSVEGARRTYEHSGSEADAHFLRDAQAAYDEALAAYEVARGAQGTAGATGSREQ